MKLTIAIPAVATSALHALSCCTLSLCTLSLCTWSLCTLSLCTLSLCTLSLCTLSFFSVPEARAETRGLLTSRQCPYSCRTERIEKSHCRDWREGNTCYVEDLSKPAAAAPAPVAPPVAPPSSLPRWGGATPTYDNPTRGPDNRGGCENIARRDLTRPRASVGPSRPSGGFFDNKFKVTGSVEGTCLVEAGLFENGQKVQEIPIVTTREFKRFEFDLRAHGDRNPEIRVYNVAGDRETIPLSSNGAGATNNPNGNNYGGNSRNPGGYGNGNGGSGNGYGGSGNGYGNNNGYGGNTYDDGGYDDGNGNDGYGRDPYRDR